jgi:hypothetical protein
MAIPGDIVRVSDRALIVVDVTADDELGDAIAVLRSDEDLDLLEPVAAIAADLEVIGHLEHLDGWVEDNPGIWSQV